MGFTDTRNYFWHEKGPTEVFIQIKIERIIKIIAKIPISYVQ